MPMTHAPTELVVQHGSRLLRFALVGLSAGLSGCGHNIRSSVSAGDQAAVGPLRLVAWWALPAANIFEDRYTSGLPTSSGKWLTVDRQCHVFEKHRLTGHCCATGGGGWPLLLVSPSYQLLVHDVDGSIDTK